MTSDPSPAQDAPVRHRARAGPAARRFDLVTLFVRDLAAMVRFYRDTVGIPTAWDGTAPYAEFHHPGVRFALFDRGQLEETMGVEATYPPGRNGTFALSFPFDDPVLVDAEHARLVEEGGVTTVYGPRDEPWGLRSAMVEDPEGNLLELAAWLPEAD